MTGTKFQDSFSEEVWASTYKDHNDISINDSLRRVAIDIASVEDTKEKQEEWSDKFYDLLSNFKGVAGGRIMANAGTGWKNTTYLNCFVGTLPDQDLDSINSIYQVLVDQANTLKSEGGWGMDFSWIRPRGSFIDGVGVDSPGAIKFMELFDKSSEIVTSGSGRKSSNKKAKGKIRKGAMMGVISCTHPDVVEFITAKQTPNRLSKFNVSVNCTDEFMNLVINGGEDAEWHLEFPDTKFPAYKMEWHGSLSEWKSKGYPVIIYNTVKVQWLWNLIMESTYSRNEPGVLFLDRANAYNPLNYGETILSTNPCVTADTWTQTEKGPRQVYELLDKKAGLIINGIKHSATNFFKTGIKDIYELRSNHGFKLKLTADHPVRVRRGSEILWVPAIELKNNDNILLHNHKDIAWAGTGNIDEGYLVGQLIGDGWVSPNNKATLSVFDRDENIHAGPAGIMNRVLEIHEKINNDKKVWWHSESRKEYRYSSKTLNNFCEYLELNKQKTINEKLEKCSSEFYRGFLSGLFDADGTVLGDVSGGATIRLWHADVELLSSVQRMLLRLGIVSTVYENRSLAHTKYMPDGKGGTKEYNCKSQHELSISKNNIIKFYDIIGFADSVKSLKLKTIIGSYNKGPYKEKFEDKFKSLTYIGQEEVYDVSVPVINAFDANGFYVHNCGEQPMAPGGICCLGTINLTQFVNEQHNGFDLPRLRKYVRYLVRFLDNVNSRSAAPLQEYEDSMRYKRRIGCGVMGWGSSLFMMQIRFGSELAGSIRDELMTTYARTAYETSIDLAIEKGMFAKCDPKKHADSLFVKNLGLSKDYMIKLRTTGIRNSSILSQQPNGNTSILANIVSGGIEPVFMPEYTRTVIVQHIPAHLASITPKYYEGVMEETEMFKWIKEGDDDVLRGVDKFGTVYKIDRNRGLTREVLCEDYGVRYLKTIGKWDTTADFAVTTSQLSVDDHINDLYGFARLTDAACSKTCNLPNDYSYADFKNLYQRVYETGVIKGFTTYRSGTMMSVLAAADERHATSEDEEIILENVQLPESAPASMKTLRAEGRKWWLTVVYNEQQTRPFALFVHTNNHEKNVTTSTAVEVLTDLAIRKGIPQIHIDETIAKISGDDNASKIARVISLNLRHGVLIKNIVSTLDNLEDVYVGSFLFQIKKFLASFIKDGEKVQNEVCSECNSTNVVYEEGCKKCVNCGSSKCS